MIASGDTVDLLIGRRNIEGGPRFFDYDHTNYRAMAGVRGDLSDAWSYDTYASYYDTDLFNGNNGYISIDRSSLGLNGCQQSADPTDLAAGCVPWNIWQDGGVTPAATDYLFAFGLAQGSATQAIAAANFTGDLGAYGLQLPTAEEGIGVAVGAEYRRDTFGFLPDQTLGSGDLSGSGGASPTINAATDVSEMYAEFRVPLLQGVTGAQDLVFETGYRYSDYELSGGVDTYKFGLQWAPIESVRLRGSFNHAIRAPSLIELFNPQTVTNTSVFSVDPCAGANPTASLAECQRTGMTAAQYGNTPQCPAAQCAVLTGGNPLVEPEMADTITFGFTYNPTALPELTVSLDWYEIEVEDIIGNIPLNTIFNGCASGIEPRVLRQRRALVVRWVVRPDDRRRRLHRGHQRQRGQGDLPGRGRAGFLPVRHREPRLARDLDEPGVRHRHLDAADRGRGGVRLRWQVWQPVRSGSPGLARFAALLLALPG